MIDRQDVLTKLLDAAAAAASVVMRVYAESDVGVELMRAHGHRRGLVELGGDLRAFDDRSTPQPFVIGVRDPDRPGTLAGTLRIDGGAVVTSGDYERGYTIAGRRYSHVVDPRTGRPSETVRSVTLVAPTGVRADALATAVLVMGERDGSAFVDRTAGVEAILVVVDTVWR